MKKVLSNKWVKLGIIFAIVIFLVVGIVIPFVDSLITSANHHIEDLVHDIFADPAIDERSASDITEDMEEYVNSAWEKEKFEELAVEAIENMNGGVDYVDFKFTIFDITAQQILLEAAGYKSEALNNAFDDKINELLEVHDRLLGFEKLTKSLMEEPRPDEGNIYDAEFEYYTTAQSVFINKYLPEYIAEKKEKAFSSNDTATLLSVCKDMSVLSQYSVFDIDQMIDTDDFVDILTTDAEKIIVKNGVGGYYDGRSDETSSDYEKDDALSAVGTHGTSTVSTSKFFGDLASYYYERTGNYHGEDSDGGHLSINETEVSRREVFLKGTCISNNLVDEKYIEYAYEDDMINYHKDGYCYGISDDAIVCYLGNETFIFEFE